MKIDKLFSVEGKVVLVTGGSRGIGKMIARGFVENGAKTYITARNAEACATTAAELSRLGNCIALPIDISTMKGITALVAQIAASEPVLHVLVNNAGATWNAPFAEYPENAWDKVLNLNVKSPFFLAQALLPQLRAAASHADPARIINIGSADGIQVPDQDTYAYAASKAGIHHLTRMLAARLAKDHINVNAVAPGPFESKMMAATIAAYHDQIVAAVPRGRLGEPDDMAAVALYLASRAGSYVTGAVIPVDGGLLLHS